MRAGRHLVVVLFAGLLDDGDDALVAILADLHRATHFGDRGLALGLARFEDFFDSRKTRDDVFGCDAAGVEGTQRELRARFADRLGRDDADRRSDVDLITRGQVASVAQRTDAVLRFAR